MNKTLIFDLGNVLVFFDYSRMYAQVAHLLKIPTEKIQQILLVEEVGKRYEYGFINTQELYDYFRRLSPTFFSLEDFKLAISNIFTLNETMDPVIKSLKANNHRLILLSNTCEAHYEHIKTYFDIVHDFEHVILSYQVQARKPEKAIYEAAWTAAKSSPQQCFYVDDIPEYVQAARELGIDAEIYRNTAELKQQLEARGFRV